jgi:hypothetical protein
MGERDMRSATVEIGWHETVRLMCRFLRPAAPLLKSLNDADLQRLATVIETARQRLREQQAVRP